MKLATASILLAFAIVSKANGASCDRHDGGIVVNVPDDNMSKAMNILLRALLLLIYGGLLGWTVLNIHKFLVLKKRYKEVSILLYYIFFSALFVTRIVQTTL